MSIRGPAASFVEILDYSMDQNPDNFNGFPLRPSAAGHCTKKLAYDTTKYLGKAEYTTEDKPARVKRLLSLGHSIETHLIWHLKTIYKQDDTFRIKYKQQALPLFTLDAVGDEEPPEIEGAMDLAFEMHGELGFVDIKSYGEKWSSFYKKKTDEMYQKFDLAAERFSENGWWVEDLPSFMASVGDPFLSDNFYQLNAYCNSDFAKRKKVTYGSIIKYCKNDSSMWEIRFKPHEGMYEEVRQKFQKAYEAAMKGDPETVTRDYALGTARCAFCDYKTACYPQKDALKMWFKTWPKKKWPVDENELPPEVPGLFEKFESAHEQGEAAKALENEIAQVLTAAKIQKLRLANGRIYEIKALKTGGVAGGPRMVVRRTKL